MDLAGIEPAPAGLPRGPFPAEPPTEALGAASLAGRSTWPSPRFAVLGSERPRFVRRPAKTAAGSEPDLVRSQRQRYGNLSTAAAARQGPLSSAARLAFAACHSPIALMMFAAAE
jgi:hypothetical protein